MCGLVGVVGNIGIKEEKAFKNLLALDVLRGEHSTGIATVNKNTGEISIAKQVGSPWELFQDRRFDLAMRGLHQVLIGHNRYATVGAVNRNNAHPFQFDHIVGAHNGTLTSRLNLYKQNQFHTDSEALYHHIYQKGLEDALKNCSGAYALTWWDGEKNTMNFLRNDDRPLYLTVSENSDTMFWASEKWMLEVALSKNGIKYLDIASLKEDVWFSIELNKGTIVKDTEKVVKCPKVPASLLHQPGTGTNKSKPGSNNTSNKSNVYPIEQSKSFNNSLMGCKGTLFEITAEGRDEQGGHFYKCQEPISGAGNIRLYVNLRDKGSFEVGDLITGDISLWKDGYFKITSTSAKVVSVPDSTKMYADAKGNLLTREEWKKKYSDCAWCSSPLDPDDDNEMSKDGDVICPSCASDPEIKIYLVS